jgi:hypothetical protein
MKLPIAIVAVVLAASAAQAQLGPGASWPISSPSCASWSIAPCRSVPAKAAQRPRPTSRQQVRRSRSQHRWWDPDMSDRKAVRAEQEEADRNLRGAARDRRSTEGNDG